MDHSNYAGHVHNKRRLPLAWLLFLLLTCLSSCTPARQEETVSAQPSYEQYSQQELQDQIKGEQEAFDAFTELVFRDSIQQNTISLHYYLTDPEAFGITDYPITLGDYSSQAIRDSHIFIKACCCLSKDTLFNRNEKRILSLFFNVSIKL